MIASVHPRGSRADAHEVHSLAGSYLSPGARVADASFRGARGCPSGRATDSYRPGNALHGRRDLLLVDAQIVDMATGEIRPADVGIVGEMIASVHPRGIDQQQIKRGFAARGLYGATADLSIAGHNHSGTRIMVLHNNPSLSGDKFIHLGKRLLCP
jgi:hypothetical protein